MQKFSITPIGTCRINNPLRQAQPKYPILINTARVYGYTHTSAEALQQVRYLQGEQSFAEQVRPILFRPDPAPGGSDGDWTPSDLHMVEISSAKKITCRADSVQINYLYRHFSEFFSNGKRTQRFWSLIKREQHAELAEFLGADPAYALLSPADQALLASLRMEEQDFASLKADMAEIAERLGRDTVIFMTHVNARTPDGATIPARERLINWVKLAAGQLQVPCFDPTAAMEAMGQERALEHGGLDLTHFTQSFSDRVYAEIHREHVGRMMEAMDLPEGQDAALRQHLLAENIEALIKFDDFLSGSRRLYAALRKEPDAPPLIQLRGKILSQIGDFEGALRALEGLNQSSSLSPDGKVALLEAYTATEQWAEALALAELLLGDEHESGIIYACAAAAYEQTGQPERALNAWKQSFRHDRTNFTAALKVLTSLSQLGDASPYQAWREEVLEHSASGVGGTFEIARWALDHQDGPMFAKVFGAICRVDVSRAETLIDSLISAGMLDTATDCLRQLAGCGNSVPPASAVRIAAQSGRVAAELLASGEFQWAHELAAAAAAIRPGGLPARTERAALAHFRSAVREAYAQQDYPAVVAVWKKAGDVILAATDAALPVALSLHKLGDNGAALDLLTQIHQRDPSHPGVLRWAGRIGAALGRYDIALQMYAALRQSDHPAAAKYAGEATRFFQTADRRALRQLRTATLNGEFRLAGKLVELLHTESGESAGLTSELERLNRRLRLQLREIENGAADEEGREQVLSLLLRIKPDDAAILRRAALEAMRKMRFEQAAQYWGRLNQLAPEVESNARNLERCRVLAAREAKASAARRPEPVA
ncbi:hypothetical protein [uncultured Sphingomonas sp.]|uniref:hypothetical protein n=1 Tax=uncultured Sphingomonas sp. TaxID=158754 RepID=UPI0025E7860F|nr:hypothetical protein [uncultured Sphingomonas sp.]